MEANPSSVEAERFPGLSRGGSEPGLARHPGAERCRILRALGTPPQHSGGACRALQVARNTFERVSFDLIYARSGTNPRRVAGRIDDRRWRSARKHLSLYQLTIEPDTMFERLVNSGKLKVPDIETQRELWEVTQEVMNRAGMPAYEISNHARPGAEGRHNLVYWRYGEYAGVGPGAHGRLVTAAGRRAMATEKHPEMWLTCVETEGHGIVEDEQLSIEEQGDEFLLMGLRLTEGIDPARFHVLRGKPLATSRVAELIADGLVEYTRDGRLRVSAEGFPVLDAVVADLAA